jgi:hypothetical protein
MPRTLFSFWCISLHDIWVVDGTYQASYNCYWHLSICLTVVPRYRSDRYQLSIASRWHLALCQHLLLITFQLRTYNYGVYRNGNHWASYCQLEVWLVMYIWDVMVQPLHSPVIFLTLNTLPSQRKPSPAIRHLTLNVSLSGYKPLGQVWQILNY